MTVREILQLGNPQLYKTSEDVILSDMENIPQIVLDLHDTMMDFRKRYGVVNSCQKVGHFVIGAYIIRIEQ